MLKLVAVTTAFPVSILGMKPGMRASMKARIRWSHTRLASVGASCGLDPLYTLSAPANVRSRAMMADEAKVQVRVIIKT